MMLQDQLDDVIRIFVYADTVTRVRRIMDVDKVDEEEALRRMRKIDKERTEYHKYFTGRNWMDMENYDLPINASRIDYDEMIIPIKDYLSFGERSTDIYNNVDEETEYLFTVIGECAGDVFDVGQKM